MGEFVSLLIFFKGDVLLTLITVCNNKIYLLHPLRVEVTSMNSFRMDTASSDLHTRYTKEREIKAPNSCQTLTDQPSGLAFAGR